MKNIYLLCNAHIDPVWLWRWQEGAATALSTFRCAADFCDEFDGFVFNHNESLLYKWIEEYEPALFERIRAHVKSGKWKIIGGWYNQPDCNLPSGESFARQALYGKSYFIEKFGVDPETALNYDSFGHSRGLVQILKKSGYKNYILTRIMEPGDYKWVGFDGSEIILHKSFEGYNTTLYGESVEKIDKYIKEKGDSLPENSMLLWGVGDHGGGASRFDIREIAKFAEKAEKDGIKIIHSTPDEYFATLDINKLTPYTESVRPFSAGCYTTMANIKKAHRNLENSLYMTEKMMVHANLVCGTPYDKNILEQTAEDLMFCQFHDILPGTMIEPGEKDSLNRLGHGITNAEALQARAFFALSSGEEKAKENEIPVLVYNPHPYTVKAQIECEYQLANQNWNPGEFTVAKVYDRDGNPVHSQFAKEACNLHLDWRKNIVIDAELTPSSMNRFNCVLEVERNYEIWDIKKYGRDFSFKNDEMEIIFNPETGLIDSYTAGGKKMLDKNSGRLIVINDISDPWGMFVEAFSDVAGEFKLLTKEQAAQFIGYPDSDTEPFAITEDGDVRTVVEGLYGYNHSFANIKYYIPKRGSAIRVDVTLHMSEANKMVKLSFNTIDGEFMGQTAFGTEGLPMEGKAAVFQKYCAVKSADATFIISNNGTYSGDFENGVLNQTLLRTSGYSAYPFDDIKAYEPSDRYMKHIDMGVREFSFEFYGDKDIKSADFNACVFNEKPVALSFFPSGEGKKCGSFITIDNKSVTMSAFKKAHNDNGYIIRLYNSSPQDETASIKIPCLNIDKNISFGKYEIKTFRINSEIFEETDIIERKL